MNAFGIALSASWFLRTECFVPGGAIANPADPEGVVDVGTKREHATLGKVVSAWRKKMAKIVSF